MMDDYEGAEEMERAWREGLTPDPMLTVSQWSDRHRMLSSKASAEPGRWRTSRTPYLQAIMDCLSPTSPLERVVFMKAAQLGATEMGSNWMGYVIHHAPGPMMAVWPTVEMAKRNSKQRIDPLIEESPALAELIAPARSRDSGNTVLSKEFRGGVIWDFATEFFFKRHNQLNSIKAVCAQIINKRCAFNNLITIYTQMFNNDAFYALCNVTHFHLP